MIRARGGPKNAALQIQDIVRREEKNFRIWIGACVFIAGLVLVKLVWNLLIGA